MKQCWPTVRYMWKKDYEEKVVSAFVNVRRGKKWEERISHFTKALAVMRRRTEQKETKRSGSASFVRNITFVMEQRRVQWNLYTAKVEIRNFLRHPFMLLAYASSTGKLQAPLQPMSKQLMEMQPIQPLRH